MNTITLINLTVAAAPTYYPASTDATGKFHTAACIVPCYDNSQKNAANVAPSFDIKFYGGAADSAAKYCPPGKTITVIGNWKPQLTEHAVLKDGVWVKSKDANNQPVTYWKTVFTSNASPSFHDDSEAHLQSEYNSWNQFNNPLFGRPVGWNQSGSVDNQTWKNHCLPARKAMMFQPGSTQFGWAKVGTSTFAQQPVQQQQYVQQPAQQQYIQQPVQQYVQQPIQQYVQPATQQFIQQPQVQQQYVQPTTQYVQPTQQPQETVVQYQPAQNQTYAQAPVKQKKFTPPAMAVSSPTAILQNDDLPFTPDQEGVAVEGF